MSQSQKIEHLQNYQLQFLHTNDQIDTYAFRQIFYYKSRINKSLDGNGHDYCFSGFESMTKRFRISRSKVEEANKQLKKAKLLKIVKHKLEPTHE